MILFLKNDKKSENYNQLLDNISDEKITSRHQDIYFNKILMNRSVILQIIMENIQTPTCKRVSKHTCVLSLVSCWKLALLDLEIKWRKLIIIQVPIQWLCLYLKENQGAHLINKLFMNRSVLSFIINNDSKFLISSQLTMKTAKCFN